MCCVVCVPQGLASSSLMYQEPWILLPPLLGRLCSQEGLAACSVLGGVNAQPGLEEAAEARGGSNSVGALAVGKPGPKRLPCGPPPSCLHPAADTWSVQPPWLSSGPVTTRAGELFPGDGHIPREARACCEQSGPTSQVSVFLIGQNKLLQAPFC